MVIKLKSTSGYTAIYEETTNFFESENNVIFTHGKYKDDKRTEDMSKERIRDLIIYSNTYEEIEVKQFNTEGEVETNED